MCGGTFLKAIYDLYVTTEGVMDNEVAKSFLQLFADVLVFLQCAYALPQEMLIKAGISQFCTVSTPKNRWL